LGDVDPEKTSLLIMPGGEMGHKIENQDLTDLIHQVHRRCGIVAGICTAPLHLGKIGLFNEGFHHTSNGLDYLEYYLPDYDLQDFYVDT
jgi:putative intracellular protease/amidase